MKAVYQWQKSKKAEMPWPESYYYYRHSYAGRIIRFPQKHTPHKLFRGSQPRCDDGHLRYSTELRLSEYPEFGDGMPHSCENGNLSCTFSKETHFLTKDFSQQRKEQAHGLFLPKIISSQPFCRRKLFCQWKVAFRYFTFQFNNLIVQHTSIWKVKT